jgi:multicomponent Na+:H+ antiporter subunit F
MAETSEIIRIFLQIGIIFLSITMILCLIRAVKGPKLADRIIATNMVGIKTILLIAMVAVYIEGDFLIDVAMVYALLSFLAVVVFARFMLRVKINRAKKNNNK